MNEELPRKEEIKFVVNGQLDKSIRTTNISTTRVSL